jgi:hypothetical protein
MRDKNDSTYRDSTNPQNDRDKNDSTYRDKNDKSHTKI